MATQITVRLSDDLGRTLKTAADRVRHLIGSLESGVPDLAARHREYLMTSLKRGR